MTWFQHRGNDRTMSDRWLRSQERQETRIEYHSPPMQWPVTKLQNERGWVNRIRLKAEVAERA